MATVNVIDSLSLRNAIQAALPGDVINLSGNSAYSVLTLAKLPSSTPTAVPASGYIIQGNGRTVQNTRILQQNVDGPFGPGTVEGTTNNLNLVYTSGGAIDGTALLRASSASYTLNKVNINGVNRGWDGNGNLYMSLTSFSYSAPISVNFSFNNSAVNITGQGGFDPTGTTSAAGGSSFLHSWNNTGTVSLNAINFNENGYLAAFNFTNFVSSSTPIGVYNITGCTFRRSSAASRVVRHQGNRLSNVSATLTANVFQDGSYLDLYGNSSQVKFAGSNTFNTIANGYGIRATALPGVTTGNPVLQANAQLVFSGAGVALKYISSTPNDTFRLDTVGGTNSRNISIGPTSFQELIAAGQADDIINPAITSTNVWISGDDGNDLMNGSSGNDLLLGGTGNDSIFGLIGSDSLDGGSGADFLDGSFGSDSLLGAAGNDVLDGGDGQDVLNGGDDNDLLIGGHDEDVLTGGAGLDRFVLSVANATDTITDFSAVDDQLAVGTIFANTLPDQTLDAADYAVVASLASLTSADSGKVVAIQSAETTADIEAGSYQLGVDAYVLVYNSSAGFAQLWYDNDWSDNFGERTQLATLGNITSASGLTSFSNTNFFATSDVV
jgi:Ca2+-binding RTX toxin-like protein